MSDTDANGENAFQHLKRWVVTNTTDIATGKVPDHHSSCEAFITLGVVVDHVEQFMSVDRRREMALAIQKVLTP